MVHAPFCFIPSNPFAPSLPIPVNKIPRAPPPTHFEIDSKRRKLISKNLLYGIIKPRYEEILEIIRDKIFNDINARLDIKSVVLTGGASKIFGIKNISENIFNRNI